MPTRLNNISFFFKSDCCKTNDGDSSTSETSFPLSELSKKKWNTKVKLQEYEKLKEYFINKDSPKFATTITFGRKYYWSMNNKEQYNAIRNILQAYVRERKSSCLYIAEVNKSGVLHFHGIECYETQALFIKRFEQFGKHNANDKSYQPVGDITKYMEYMFKDQFKRVYCAYNDSEATESTQTDTKYFGKKAWIHKFRPIFKVFEY